MTASARSSRDSGIHRGGYLPWFYDDYRRDQRVRTLNGPEDHIYRILIEEQWSEGSIPNDVEALFRLVWRIGTPPEFEPAYRAGIDRVAQMFFVPDEEDSSRLVNPRLCEIAQAARERRLRDHMRTHAATQARLAKQPAGEEGGNGKAPGTALVRKTTEQITTELAAWHTVAAERSREELDQNRERLIIEVVFAYWAFVFGHEKAVLDRKRYTRLRSRYHECKHNPNAVSELLWVCNGAKKSDHLMGRKADSTEVYDGIQTIYRDREQVEKLGRMATRDPAADIHPMARKYANICFPPGFTLPPENS